jgi:hypothetical protein
MQHIKCPALIMIDRWDGQMGFPGGTLKEGDDSHFMSEITGIKIVPLLQHENKGINRFLENSFAGSSRDDLDVLLREVFHLTL